MSNGLSSAEIIERSFCPRAPDLIPHVVQVNEVKGVSKNSAGAFPDCQKTSRQITGQIMEATSLDKTVILILSSFL